jgi:hypothetical protein
MPEQAMPAARHRHRLAASALRQHLILSQLGDVALASR